MELLSNLKLWGRKNFFYWPIEVSCCGFTFHLLLRLMYSNFNICYLSSLLPVFCLLLVVNDLSTAQDEASAAIRLGERSVPAPPQHNNCGLPTLRKLHPMAAPAPPHLPLGRGAPPRGQETNSWGGERWSGITETISGIHRRPSHVLRWLPGRAVTASSAHVEAKQYRLGGTVWSGRSAHDSRQHQGRRQETEEVNG